METSETSNGNNYERKKIISKLTYYLKLIEARGIDKLTKKQLQKYHEFRQQAEAIGWKPLERLTAEESLKRNKLASLDYYYKKKEDPEWRRMYNERQKEYYHKRKASKAKQQQEREELESSN